MVLSSASPLWALDCASAAADFRKLARPEIGTEEKIQRYQEIITTCPRLVEAAYNLALVQIEAKQYEEALATLTKAAEASDQARIVCLQGVVALRQGDLSRAEEYLNKALQIEPANMTGLLASSELAAQRKNWTAVLDLSQKILSVDSRSEEALLNRVVALDALDKKTELFSALTALAEVSTSLSAETCLALMIKYERFTEAQKFIEKSGVPEHAPVMNLLAAHSYYRQGKFEMSRAAVLQAKLAEDVKVKSQALQLLALIEFTQKNYAAASDAVTQVLQLTDNVIALSKIRQKALSLSGLIALEKGDLEVALRYFSQAIELDPGDKTSHHNRGLVYEQLGKSDLSKLDFELSK